jgi:hypothetical protein
MTTPIFFDSNESRIKNPVHALLTGLVLAVTAPTEETASYVLVAAEELIQRFQIPEPVVESCKALAERLIQEHATSYFAEHGKESILRFGTQAERDLYVSNNRSASVLSFEEALPNLLNRIAGGG